MARTKVLNVQKKKGDSDIDYTPSTGQSPLVTRPRQQKTSNQAEAGPMSIRPKMMENPKPVEKRRATTIEKSKAKVGISPMDKRPRTPSPASSDTKTDSSETELNRAVVEATKIAHIRKKPRTGSTSSIPSSESNLPFLDGNLDAEVDQLRYKKYFREKPFCPVVSVNFQALKNDTELNLDLSEMLRHYECWLKVDEEFSLEVVRKFYCNMTMTTKDDDAEVVRTRLRGREIELTREKLNEFLGAP